MITGSKLGIFIGHRQIGKQKTGSSQSFSSTAGSADKPVCWKAVCWLGEHLEAVGMFCLLEGVYVLWRNCSCRLTILRHLLVGYLLWVCFLPGSSLSSCFPCDGLGGISLWEVSSSVTEGSQLVAQLAVGGPVLSTAGQGGWSCTRSWTGSDGPEPFSISTRLFDGGTQNMLKFFSDIHLGGKGGSKDNY